MVPCRKRKNRTGSPGGGVMKKNQKRFKQLPEDSTFVRVFQTHL
jgi:hypothetical protein